MLCLGERQVRERVRTIHLKLFTWICLKITRTQTDVLDHSPDAHTVADEQNGILGLVVQVDALSHFVDVLLGQLIPVARRFFA